MYLENFYHMGYIIIYIENNLVDHKKNVDGIIEIRSFHVENIP
jgi:hypothetical protein